MSSKHPTLVWVPGSWLSTDIYRKMASRLWEYRSIVIDQPTNKMRPGSKDMHEDITHTHHIIENELDLGNDVVVIAHSAGGLIGSHATRGLSKIARLSAGRSSGVMGFIGVAALMPFPGKTVAEMIAEFGIPKLNALATKGGPPKTLFEDISAMYTFNEVCLNLDCPDKPDVKRTNEQDSTMDNMDPYYLFYNDLVPEKAEFWINKHELHSSAYVTLPKETGAMLTGLAIQIVQTKGPRNLHY